jgi:hypothetical protein
MVEKESDLYRIVSAITTPQTTLAPTRTYCMNCKSLFRTTPMTQKLFSSSNKMLKKQSSVATASCSRSVCNNCCKVRLPTNYFLKSSTGTTPPPPPTTLENHHHPPSSSLWPCCIVCEKILTLKKEVMSYGTQPTTTTTISNSGDSTNFFESYDNDDLDRYSC